MKKGIFLGLLVVCISILCCPFVVVNAKGKDVEITSIKLLEKTDSTEELTEAKIENSGIHFNLKFSELNANAKYEVKIKNNSNIEYKVSDSNQLSSNDSYITYKFDYDNGSDVIQPKSEKIMYITISYDKEVDESNFDGNVYKSDNHINIGFSDQESNDAIVNPNTSNNAIVVVSIILLLLFISILLIKKKKASICMSLILTLMVPVVAKAIELFKFDIYAHIEIERAKTEFTLCGKDNVYQFEEGMTFFDWLESEYNTSGLEASPDLYGMFFTNGYLISGCDSDLGCEKYIDFSTKIVNKKDYYCVEGLACVSPLSKIMISEDNKTKLAKDMKDNDSIVYYDFTTKKMEVGKVKKVYIHKDATSFVKYTLEDGTYLEATDYHPIYTEDGWKSYTRKNGYPKPVVGDKVKINSGWKKITKIETYNGKDDFYDFAVLTKDGERADNYYANGILVQSSIK